MEVTPKRVHMCCKWKSHKGHGAETNAQMLLLHVLAARHATTGFSVHCVGFYSCFRPIIVSCFHCCSFDLQGVVWFLFIWFLNICLQIVIFHESQGTPWTFLKQNQILGDDRDSSSWIKYILDDERAEIVRSRNLKYEITMGL